MKQFNKTVLCKLIHSVYEPLPKLENTGVYLLSSNSFISNRLVYLYQVNSLLKRYSKRMVFV